MLATANSTDTARNASSPPPRCTTTHANRKCSGAPPRSAITVCSMCGSELRPTNSASASSSCGGHASMKIPNTVAATAAVTPTATANVRGAISRALARANERVRRTTSLTGGGFPRLSAPRTLLAFVWVANVRIQVSERACLRGVQAHYRSAADCVRDLRCITGGDRPVSGTGSFPRLGVLLDGLRPRQTEEGQGRGAGGEVRRQEGEADGEEGR